MSNKIVTQNMCKALWLVPTIPFTEHVASVPSLWSTLSRGCEHWPAIRAPSWDSTVNSPNWEPWSNVELPASGMQGAHPHGWESWFLIWLPVMVGGGRVGTMHPCGWDPHQVIGAVSCEVAPSTPMSGTPISDQSSQLWGDTICPCGWEHHQ